MPAKRVPANERLEGFEEVLARLLRSMPPEEIWEAAGVSRLLGSLTPAQRLADLTPEQRLLALPVSALCPLSEEYRRTLPADVQAAIRKRIEHEKQAPQMPATEVPANEKLEGHDEVRARLFRSLSSEEIWEAAGVSRLLGSLPPEQRLADLTPEQQLLALPASALRALSEDYLRALPADVQAAIHKRIESDR